MSEPATREAAPRRDEPARPLGPPSRQITWPSTSYWIGVTVAVALTLVVLSAVRSVSSILVLILIAAVLAIGLDPAVELLIRRFHFRKRGGPVAIIFIAALLLLVLFIMLVGPPLVHQVSAFATDIPTLIPRLARRNDWLGTLVADHQGQIQDFIATLPQRIASSFGTILGFTGKIGGLIFSTLTAAVLTVFFMLSMPTIKHGVALLFAPENRPQAVAVIEKCNARIGGYVSGNLATSAICAVGAGIAMGVLGVPFAVPLALWAGIADLIPTVGSYLGAIPAILVAFSKSPLTAILVLAYFIVYQQIENYIVVPRVMRNAVELSSPAVLIATMIGASLAGFAGALLALPVAATIKVLITDVWYAGRVRAAAARGVAWEADVEPPPTAASAGNETDAADSPPDPPASPDPLEPGRMADSD
jgi:predicted PurR-regulated permease PerM